MQEEEKLFQKENINKDRETVIDANVVKVMKARKILQMEYLCEQASKMIKVFAPAKRDIKNSIERLINKEILERDEKSAGTIRYK